MSSYDKWLADWQAEASANLERDIAKAKKAHDPLHNHQTQFLMLLISVRLEKGLSQAALSAKVGMQQSALARIESGKGNPTLHTLLKIAKVLDARLVLE